MNLRTNLALLLLFVGGALCAAQTDRVVFNFTSTDPARALPWTATSVLESGLTTQGWTLGPGLSLVPARSNRLAFAIAAGSDQLSTLIEARAASAYLNVRFTSSAGPLNLASNRIRFTIRRESWHAPLRFAVYSSTDSFASPLFISEEVEQLDDGTHSFSFLLPSDGFTSVSGPVDFRIYPFAARYSGHALSLTAFSLGGPVQTYTLTATSTAGGTVQVSPSGSVFEAGQTVQIIARPGMRGVAQGLGQQRQLDLVGAIEQVAENGFGHCLGSLRVQVDFPEQAELPVPTEVHRMGGILLLGLGRKLAHG